MELHPHEIEILKALNERSTPEDIAKKTKLNPDAVMRASSWLATKGLVKLDEKIIDEITLGKEGITSLKRGLPERQIIHLMPDGGRMSDVQKRLDKNIVSIGLGWLIKKKLAKLDKGELKILKTGKTEDEELLELLGREKKIDSSDLTSELVKGFEMLKKRKNIIRVSERKKIWLMPTKDGIKKGKTEKTETISQLTPELIISGEWKDKRFRPYDVDVFVNPEIAAKKHPLQRLIERIREIFVEMGFNEIGGPMVESAFWNFDALFQPQDHPARDMHDTFYLKRPKEVEIPDFEKFKDDIKNTHENGGTTGSTGWGGSWSEEVTKKALLRTHTTAVTCRHLSKLKREDLPVKVFSIGKVFRNEAIDYKHLPEFYQVEGIVVDENVNFRNLLGILKEFYDHMGLAVRFRPGYFPYTEMSVEPEVFFEEKGEWIELGGAGIFRPEVVKPLLGFDCPVLAWGLGLDRVVALKLGLTDIRELYISDLNWLRKSGVVDGR